MYCGQNIAMFFLLSKIKINHAPLKFYVNSAKCEFKKVTLKNVLNSLQNILNKSMENNTLKTIFNDYNN